MSISVVIVSEDPTNNGYILDPLIETVLAACGKPNARVSVLSNPRTSVYEHAKSLLRSELIERYKFVDLLLFLPDRDGKDRQAEFTALEEDAAQKGTTLLCCAAQEEIETWLLAGHVSRLTLPWSEIRSDDSVKENVFKGFLEQFGHPRRPGGGRRELMLATLANYQGLKSRCPELAELERRVQKALMATG